MDTFSPSDLVYACISKCKESKQYFGEIKNDFFLKNEIFFKDPEDLYSRSARPSASYTY